jgi:hypothetical protein
MHGRQGFASPVGRSIQSLDTTLTTAEWFRNTDWDSSIASAFAVKLKRARDKNQYLRIQAGYLTVSHPEAALALLDQYFLLGEHFDHAQAHVDRSKALLATGEVYGAIASLEDALQRELVFPRLLTQAYLDLPYLIATRCLRAKFDRALQLLDQGRGRLMFPIDFFRSHAARAIIFDLNGVAEAAREALKALEAARQPHSGFRYHPKLGLVSEQYGEVASKLRAIGGG